MLLVDYLLRAALAGEFQKVNQEIAAHRVPIVFFDEFDSSFGKEPLAWLKSFLAPMEDGGYQGSKVNESIFVFAGGTCSSFAEFSRQRSTRTDPHWLEFATAKGPDWVSRLHGHMNLIGINPFPDSADDVDKDDLYLIRRALFLRSRLVVTQNLKSDQRSRIDTDVLHALLHVPKYHHGSRSMRIILDLCHRNGEIRKSTIPPVSQLDMHVDGRAFMELILRGAPQDRKGGDR